ncbi:DUF72 domain-containing protein [Halobacillus yeomjeoni]|uniref:DUF72 domain-containing protein n=1 Tax=Halobacillus yeomjeoni TaxID=311194 RepID=A0A931HU78_9BACI|nr:DUF72 domain-containing protein [Halobacillus yeomjeoni]MBH0229518.1 DUF72 domain-containing protein [Halobacillus yeomjeoni]MCA0983081.1 DUF72 domain-containing protein [Halobacillus yeomjeoni]
MSINIGLTGWGDHASLYTDQTKPGNKLSEYASHFPVVEVDTAFYAIQPQSHYEKWIQQTPSSFRFVIKAFSQLTGHDRESRSVQEAKELVKRYEESIQPVIEEGKLDALLFQFPPWFDVRKQHIQKLRLIREWLHEYPLALEFRNRTWYQQDYIEQTLDFMRDHEWIHGICDEPQAGTGSVPRVLETTHPEKTLIRFHGRNVHGWNKNGRKDWREVRFLYRYNEDELKEWAERIRELEEKTPEITVLFNNNSGGDAADNAKQLQSILDLEYEGLNPRQMDLFNF